MSNAFPLYVKSTLDKLATDVGTRLGLPVLDMDSAGLMSDLLNSDTTAIIWSIGALSESPADPLWYLDFDIGVKTSLDPSQYKSLDVLSELTATFRTGLDFPVFNYTGDTVGTVQQGTLFITGSTASPAQPDRLSGLRLISVQARAVRAG